MNFKTFLIGLIIAFGFPWVFAIALPYAKMSSLPPVEYDEAKDGITGVYESKRSGRKDGAEVYGANGCATCHSQLIRPSYAGSEIHRPDWAGLPADAKNGIEDSRRETNPYDYTGEEFAYIGETRIGPDLSNVAIRAAAGAAEEGISVKQWFINHLWNPRERRFWSVCPRSFQFFDGSAPEAAAKEIPNLNSNGEALVGYLMSLRKDDPIPASLNPRAQASTPQ